MTAAVIRLAPPKMDSVLRSACKYVAPEDQPPPVRAWGIGVGCGGCRSERSLLQPHVLCIPRPSDVQLAALALRHGPDVECLELHLRLMKVFGASAVITLRRIGVRQALGVSSPHPVGDAIGARRQQLFAVLNEFRDQIHLNDAAQRGWSWAPQVRPPPA